MKIKQITENTTAGSIATVESPIGTIQTRSQKPPKSPPVKKNKKKYANQISEGAMKALAYNLKHMDPEEFKQVYNKTKEFFTKSSTPAVAPKPAPTTKTGSKAWHDTGYTDKNAAKQADEPIKEDELKEDDLIVLPGMRRMKDTSFIPHDQDRRDHEVEMARSELYAAAKDAMRIYKMIENRTEDEGLMGWQQSYITLASDYLNSVADSLEHGAATEGLANVVGKLAHAAAKKQVGNLPKTDEVQRAIANQTNQNVKNIKTAAQLGAAAGAGAAGKAASDKIQKENAGVIAGGMSNFEESSQKVDSLVTDALKIMKSPEMQDAVKALKTVLGHREYNSRPRFYQFYVQQLMDMYGKQDVNEISDFKRKELERELAHEKNNYAVAIDGKVWKIFPDQQQANNIARSLQRKGKKATVHLAEARRDHYTTKVDDEGNVVKVYPPSGPKTQKAYVKSLVKNLGSSHIGKRGESPRGDKVGKGANLKGSAVAKLSGGMSKVAEEKCPHCGGELVDESLMNEKKDACYSKVKSRYKVWPSAYASGALVKCRKVGASNWGNKSKK